MNGWILEDEEEEEDEEDPEMEEEMEEENELLLLPTDDHEQEAEADPVVFAPEPIGMECQHSTNLQSRPYSTNV
ncbi:hypothetical protein Tco_0949389 [Tanacetum coccineum]